MYEPIFVIPVEIVIEWKMKVQISKKVKMVNIMIKCKN